MNKLTESRTRQFEAANADFRAGLVHFALGFTYLFRAAKHLFAGLALSLVLITLFSQKVNAGYTEKFVSWTAAGAGTWEDKDLSGDGVPANAVCEIVIGNMENAAENLGGVRANGSAIDRYVLLQEAEGAVSAADAYQFVTMFVQADASSIIECYAQDIANITFWLVGYWDSGTYVEKFSSFTVGASAAWTVKDLTGDGVGANEICEITVANNNDIDEQEAGVREVGSAIERKILLVRAEGGGVVPVSLIVKADASSQVEVYAQTDGNINLYLMGYWSANPTGFTYVSTFTTISNPSANVTWEDKDLSAGDHNVPANSVVEIVTGHDVPTSTSTLGMRANGSALSRQFDISEAEAGGLNCVRAHVSADASSIMETYYDNHNKGPGYVFYLTGYWEPVGNTAPTAPTNLGQYDSNWSSITWGAWTNYNVIRATFTLDDPDVGDTLQFNIQVSSHSDFSFNYINSTSPATATLAQAATNYITTALANGTWYWRVMATDIGGLSSGYSSATVVNGKHFGVDKSSPATVDDLSWLKVTTTTVKLSWTAIAHDGYSGWSTYEVYYKQDGEPGTGDTHWDSSNASSLGTRTTANVTITGLTANTTYYFKIRGKDEAGNYGELSSNSCFVQTSSGTFIYADVYWPGTWNGWTVTTNLSRLYTNNMPSGYCKQTSTPTTNHECKMSLYDWSTDWGLLAGVPSYDQVLTFYDTDTNNAALSGAITGNYLTVVSPTSPGTDGQKFGFLKTSASPVYIYSVSGGTDNVNADVCSSTITITLSDSKCAEEKVLIRYSTSNWTTATPFVTAWLSSYNIYKATIPGQAAGKTVKWYAMTSTVENPVSDTDYLTLSCETNNGNNYSYTITNPQAPNAPTAHAQFVSGWTSLSFGDWTQYQTIRATFTITDNNAGDTLQFNIQFSTHSDFSFNYINSTSPATATLDEGATNYVTTALANGTWYWRVMATDDGGLSGPYSSGTAVSGRHFGIDTIDPPTPAAPILARADNMRPRLDLSWTKVEDLLSGTSNYLIYRATFSFTSVGAANVSYAGTADHPAESYNDTTDLLPNTTYFYCIAARDYAGNTAKSANSSKRTARIDIDGELTDWSTSVTAPKINASTVTAVTTKGSVSYYEWIWRDKPDDERSEGTDLDSQYDIREIRIVADEEYLYFYATVEDFADKDRINFAVAIDTNQSTTDSALNWIGDDSNSDTNGGAAMALGGDYCFNAAAHYAESILEFRYISTAADDFRIAIYRKSASGWDDPVLGGAGAGATFFSDGNNFFEVKVRRSDLGLTGEKTMRFSICNFDNVLGLIGDVDSTGLAGYNPDALDSMSIVRISTGSGTGQYYSDAADNMNSWDEEISDSDIDFWCQVSIAADGMSSNAAPSKPSNPTPADNGKYSTDARPALSWDASTDGDTGDYITSYLIEFATHTDLGSDLSQAGEHGYRVNVPSTTSPVSWTIPSDLTNDLTYYWRVYARDSRGTLCSSPDIWAVKVDSVAPAAITQLSALTGSSAGEIDLTWTATGDNDLSGALPAGSYFRIEYASWTAVVWSTNTATSGAGSYITISTTVSAGTICSRTVGSLTEGVTYYFRIWTADEIPNWSALSNHATAHAKVISGTGDDFLVYLDTSSVAQARIPRYREWTGAAYTAEADASDVGAKADGFWRLVASPVSDAKALATVDADTDLNVQIWDGSSWGASAELTSNVGVKASRGFDIAYEQVSGRLMVVYRDAADTSRVYYSTWTAANGWSGRLNTGVTVAGTIQWLKLTPKPGYDEMICVVEDYSKGITAMVWDGSAWGNKKILTGVTGNYNYQCFDAVYERLTRRGMVVFSSGTNNTVYYSTWTTSWGNPVQLSLSNVTAPVYWIKLAALEATDEILAGFHEYVVSGSPDLHAAVWDGSSWTDAGELSTDIDETTTCPFDVAYERQSGKELIVFTTSTAVGTPGYFSDYSGGTWQKSGFAKSVGVSGISWVKLAADPDTSSNDIMLVTNDKAPAVCAQRWNGTSWGTVLEAETITENTQSFAFCYRWDEWAPSAGAFDSTPPCAVSNLTALTGTYGGEIQLKWSAPGDDGAVNDNSDGAYLVRYATKYISSADFSASWVSTYTQSWTPNSTPGDEDSFTVNGLGEGVTYWFVMKTKDGDNNWSSWTSSATGVAVNTASMNYAQYEAPSAITNLSAFLVTGLASGQVRLTWTAPGDDGTKAGDQGGASSYIIRFSTNIIGDGDWDASWVSSYSTAPAHIGDYGDTETMTLTQLAEAATYYFRIKSADDAGQISVIDTTAVQAYLDNRPDLVITSADITISNNTPAADEIVFITATVRNYGAGYNASGSTWTSVQFYKGQPPAPWGDGSGTLIAYYHANSSPSYNQSFEAYSGAWSIPEGAHDLYVVIDSSETVTERIEDNNSGYIHVEAPPIPPCGISNLTAFLTGTTEGQIKLKWTAPGDDGAGVADCAGYLVKYATKYISAADFNATWVSTHTQSWTPAAFGTEDSQAIGSLGGAFTPGVTYWFVMKAYDEVPNYGVWTSSGDAPVGGQNTLNSTYAQMDVTPPSAVSDLTAETGSSPGEINLTWASPGDNGINQDLAAGSKFYIATATVLSDAQDPAYWDAKKASSEIQISTSAVGYADAQSYTVGSLIEGVTYYFRMWTVDESGNWSTLSNAATAWAKITADPAPPCAISNLTALAGSWSGDIVLKWTAPGDDGTIGMASGYLLKYASQYISADNFYASWVSTWLPSNGWSPKAADSEESYTITGLTESVTYWFVIKAYDDFNNYGIWTSSGDNSAVNNNNWSIPGVTGSSVTVLHITEVMADAVDDDTDEFIEVYNAGTSAINLNGYNLRQPGDLTDTWASWVTNKTALAVIDDAYRNGASTSSTILQPGYYAMFMDQDYGDAAKGGAQRYYFMSNCIILACNNLVIGLNNAGGDTVELWTGLTGIFVDTFTYTTPAADTPWTKITSTGTAFPGSTGDWTNNVSSSPARQHPSYTSYNMLASEISTVTVASADANTGSVNNTVLACTVPGHDDSVSQNLIGVRLSTAGTTTTMLQSDIAAIKVWQDVDGNNAYSAGDSYLGTLTYNTAYAVWECQQTASMATGAGGQKIVFTIDINVSATAGRKFQAKLPQYNGLMVGSGYHGPYDAACINSGELTITVVDATPPCAISDLTALAEGTGMGGQVTLKWSEPGDDGASGDNSAGQYLVKYATKYVGAGDFYAKWVSTWGYYTPGSTPGAETLKLLTGFSEGTTYWFAVRTKDSGNNWSVWPGTAAAINSLSFNLPTSSAPAAITTLSALTGSSGGEINLTWTAPGDDGTTGAIIGGKFAIRYATYTNVDWNAASSGWTDFDDQYELVIDTDTNNYNEIHSRTMTSLREGVTYFFRLKTADEQPNWSALSNHATAWAYITPPPPTPEGMLVYYSSSTVSAEQRIPAYRYWDGSAWSAAGSAVDVGGAASRQNVVRMCPSAVRDEAIMLNVDALADLNVSTYTPSGGWGLAGELTDNVGVITQRVFDVAYEQTSGDAVIVYRTGTGVGSELYYRTWNGTALSGATEIGTNIINIEWVRLEAKPSSDEMILVYSDNLGNIYSYVWNGSAFGNVQNILTGRASASTAQSFDIAYAQSAGVGFVVWADTATTRPWYRTWDGYSWSAATVTSHNHSALGDARWIKAAANPLNNEIMIGTFDSGTDINAEVFSSTSNVWMNGKEHDDVTSYGTSQRGFDVAYEAATGEGMIVWAESNVAVRATPQARKYVNGVWSADNAAVQPDAAGIRWAILAPDDASDDIFLITLTTANNVYSQRWNGAAWDTLTEISDNSYSLYGSASMNFPKTAAPADSIAPAAVTSFTASTTSVSGQINLSWVCPGDDYRIGRFTNGSKFRIQYATYTAMAWGSETTYNVEIATENISAQSVSAYSTSGLIYETTYFFRLWTCDEGARWSEISVGATAYCRVAPAAVTTLTALAEDDGDVALSWVAPGDDGTTGTINSGQWKIRYATYTTVDWTTSSPGWTDFDDKYEFLIDTSCAALSERAKTLTGLHGGVTYYFRIWTRDEATGINAPGNWSSISNGSTACVVKVLGVSVSTDTYNFGEVNLSASTTSISGIVVTNTGNVDEDYSMRVSSITLFNGSASVWESTDTAVGHNRFILYAIFHDTTAAAGYFVNKDTVTAVNQTSGAERYTYDGGATGDEQRGDGVPKTETRTLWLKLDMPTTVNTSKQEKITVTITAGESP